MANCFKVAPAKAMKFLMYENMKDWMCKDPTKPTFVENFVSSSAVAGFVTFGVHPVDTIKTKMSLIEGSKAPSLNHVVKSLIATDGYRGLFRGLGASIASSVPFSGINLSTFMWGKQAGDKTALNVLGAIKINLRNVLNMLNVPRPLETASEHRFVCNIIYILTCGHCQFHH